MLDRCCRTRLHGTQSTRALGVRSSPLTLRLGTGQGTHTGRASQAPGLCPGGRGWGSARAAGGCGAHALARRVSAESSLERSFTENGVGLGVMFNRTPPSCATSPGRLQNPLRTRLLWRERLFRSSGCVGGWRPTGGAMPGPWGAREGARTGTCRVADKGRGQARRRISEFFH